MTTDNQILMRIKEKDFERYQKLLELKESGKSDELKQQLDIYKFENRKDFEEKRLEIGYENLNLNGEEVEEIEEIKEIDESKIIYKNDIRDNEQLKKLSKTIYDVSDKLVFIINKEVSVKGKILNSQYDYKENIPLIRAGRKNVRGVEVTHLFFPNDSCDNRQWNVGEHLSKDLFIYNLISNKKKYVLFSEKQLENEEAVVHGIKLEMPDLSEIGYTSRLNIRLPMIFLHSITPTIKKFDNNEKLIEFTKNLGITYGKFMSYLFSRKGYTYRHPIYFEKVIGATLLSAKHGDRPCPVHPLILAKQGTGKSFLEENIFDKFDEEISLVEGSGSTIKHLIPSFKSLIVEHGACLKANRICMVDELLRILCRIRLEDRESSLGALNPLLEHSKRTFGSGNCSVEGQMKAKFFAVSNQIYGTKTMPELCERVDGAFISRLLVWYQDKEHIKYIQSQEGKQEYTPSELNKEGWLSVFDHCQTFRASYEEKKVKDIYQKYLDKFPENVNDCYSARYLHHAHCLIDGLIKLRCICEGDSSFNATNKDYADLESIWSIMINNWNCMTAVEYQDVKYLTSEEKYILEKIKRKGDSVRDSDIPKLFEDIDDPFFKIENLKDHGYLDRDKHYYKIAEDERLK